MTPRAAAQDVIGYPLLGLAVQGPLFAGAAVSLYTLVSRRWGERQAVLTLALLILPVSLADAEKLPFPDNYFDAVSVANNHAGDFGKTAFADTLDLLAAAEGGAHLGER